MVVVHNFSKRQHGARRMETRAVARSEQTTNSIDDTSQDTQAFVRVDVDERGNVRVHASEQVREYLDEMMLSNQFQQAYEQSRNKSASGSRQGAPLPPEDDNASPDVIMGDTNATSAKPRARGRGQSVFHSAKQRGRPMIPRPTRISVQQTPSPPETPIAPAVPPKPIRCLPRKQMKSFRIDDSEAVETFLVNRLKRMQQLADKKIAKAWIKGICPKKQAKFPYQNNKQEKETGIRPEVPVWWPDVETVCRFIEPDHIRREERMSLCLHLLRLRPTPAQLEEWNHHDMASSRTHQRRGWTAWLRELAGPEIFDDLPREPDHRTKYRRGLMAQMYEVAEMEEDYLNDGIDGSEMYIYEEEGQERRIPPAKRPTRPSTASTPDYEEPMVRSASSSCSRAPVKRVRQDPVQVNAQRMEGQGSDRKSDLEMIDAESAAPIVLDQDIPASYFDSGLEAFPGHGNPQRKIESGTRSNLAAEPPHPSSVTLQHHTHGLPQQGNWRGFDHGAEWRELNISSPVEHTGGNHVPFPVRPAPTTFPERQDFEFPRYQQVQQPYLNHMGHASQPEFHTVPNVPVFSPIGSASMPMDPYSIEQAAMPDLPADQHFAMTMTPMQYFMPAPVHHDFPPPMNMVGLQYQQQPDVLANRHITPMQSAQPQEIPMQPLQWHHHHHLQDQRRHQ